MLFTESSRGTQPPHLAGCLANVYKQKRVEKEEHRVSLCIQDTGWNGAQTSKHPKIQSSHRYKALNSLSRFSPFFAIWKSEMPLFVSLVGRPFKIWLVYFAATQFGGSFPRFQTWCETGATMNICVAGKRWSSETQHDKSVLWVTNLLGSSPRRWWLSSIPLAWWRERGQKACCPGQQPVGGDGRPFGSSHWRALEWLLQIPWLVLTWLLTWPLPYLADMYFRYYRLPHLIFV